MIVITPPDRRTLVERRARADPFAPIRFQKNDFELKFAPALTSRSTVTVAPKKSKFH